MPRKEVKNAYYAVATGRQKGLYDDWETCKKQVDKYPCPRYKGFVTEQEAIAYYNSFHAETPQKFYIRALENSGTVGKVAKSRIAAAHEFMGRAVGRTMSTNNIGSSQMVGLLRRMADEMENGSNNVT